MISEFLIVKTLISQQNTSTINVEGLGKTKCLNLNIIIKNPKYIGTTTFIGSSINNTHLTQWINHKVFFCERCSSFKLLYLSCNVLLK